MPSIYIEDKKQRNADMTDRNSKTNREAESFSERLEDIEKEYEKRAKRSLSENIG
jgi:hypothetical protein